MQTNRYPIDIDTAMLTSRRPWYMLAFILLFLSVLLRQPILFLASLFTFVIALVPELWYRRALRYLLVRQRVSQHRLFFGEEVTLSVSIENRKFLPLPWLQVENTIRPPLAFVKKRRIRLQNINEDTHISTWLLWPFQRVTRNYRIRCQSRGLHIFGPMRLSCSDPLGWLECEVTLPTSEALLVYPLVAPLETLGLPSRFPFGEYAAPRNLLEDPLRVAGVREYVLGDDPRRIHWKATAHTASLRSKIYESSSLRRLLVLLDAWNYSEENKGADQDIQEFAIAASASIALWGLTENYTVGLLTNCSIITSSQDAFSTRYVKMSDVTPEQEDDQEVTTSVSPPGVNVPYALDADQQERILSLLARLVPTSNTTLERLIDIEESMFSPGTTIVLVTAATSLSEGVVERLDTLRIHGSSIHIVLIGSRGTKEMPETGLLPVYQLGRKEKWHELVATVSVQSVGVSTTALQLD